LPTNITQPISNTWEEDSNKIWDTIYENPEIANYPIYESKAAYKRLSDKHQDIRHNLSRSSFITLHFVFSVVA